MFLYDLKARNDEIHKKFVGVSNERILSNLQQLFGCDARIRIRIPVIPAVNDSAEEMKNIKAFLADSHRPVKIELLPYHKMGEHKYAALGRNMTGFAVPSPEKMHELNEIFQEK